MKRKRFAAFLMAAMLLLCAGSAQRMGFDKLQTPTFIRVLICLGMR